MARLITVSIDCRNEAARRTFEESLSVRRDYLVTTGQATGAVDILLLELDEVRPQQTFAHIRNILSISPDLEVFLTASRTDPQVILEAFRLGVKEFLSQPLTRQEVEPALMRFEERLNGRTAGSETQSGKVLSVIGTRGGIGASTVAINLAASTLQARKRQPVAMMDLDMHGGDLALFLDLRAPQGLKQLANDISRLDPTIVRSSLAHHSSGLRLLISGYEGFDDGEPMAGSVMRLLGFLRSMHQYVFVDCGHVLEPAVNEALACSDQIIVVTTLSLPAVRRTKRLLDALSRQHPNTKVSVLINRYASDQKDLLCEAEKLFGVHAEGVIPNDYGTVHEAITQGTPLALTATRTAIGQWFLKVTEKIIGESVDSNGSASGKQRETKGSVWRRYFPGFKIEARGKPSLV